MNPRSSPNPPESIRRRGHRLWFPIGAAGLAIAGIVSIRSQPELEANLKAWAVTVVVLSWALLTLVWFAFLSRIRWWIRLAGLGALGLLAFGAARFVRVDGTVDGTGLPRLVWNGSPGPEGTPAPQGMASSPIAVPATAAVTNGTIPGALDTPQFLGPRRDGHLRDSRLSRDWAASAPRQLWRQPIGAGWSAFAVAGGKAITQEQRGEEEWISCYDLLSGSLLWAQTNRARFFQWQGGAGPRATPTIDGGRVFVMGGTGILDCLDAASGRRIWTRDVLGENRIGNLIWGVSASPLVLDEAVVVTGGDATNGTSVLAYRRETGEPLWRAGNDKASYASPVAATLAGKRVVLSVNAATLTAHDPRDGTVLLEHPWGTDKWPKASQPVILDGDRVFLSAGYGVGCVMLRVKAGADGRLVAEELWRNKMMKTQFNSAAAREGFLYGLDDGLLACVDAMTGQRRWKDGRYGAGQSLLVDDLILIQSEAGPVVLAAASPDGFNELGRVAALSSKTWNYPTLAGRYLLVRNDTEAACYELPVVSGP